MKKCILMLCVLCLATIMVLPVFAQDKTEVTPIPVVVVEPKNTDRVLICPDLLGILYGYYGISFDIKMTDSLALYVEPAYFNVALMPILGRLVEDEGLSLWYLKGTVGVTWYPREIFDGFFIRGYVKAQIFTLSVDDDVETVGADVTSLGLGIQLGGITGKGSVRFSYYGGVEYMKGFVSSSEDNKYSSIDDISEDAGSDIIFSLLGINGLRPSVTFAISFAL